MYWDWARREANDRQVWLGESPEAQKNRGKSLRVTIMVAKSVSRRKCRPASERARLNEIISAAIFIKRGFK
jgi:hypothetical protein